MIVNALCCVTFSHRCFSLTHIQFTPFPCMHRAMRSADVTRSCCVGSMAVACLRVCTRAFLLLPWFTLTGFHLVHHLTLGATSLCLY